MRLKLRVNAIAFFFGLIGALGGTSAHALNNLPACNPGPGGNCLQFGDFNVFSLPLLGLTQSATPGALQTDTVIGINNGNAGANNNSNVLDSSFNTPSASSVSTFSTLTTQDPGNTGQFTGDFQSWDAPLTQLKSLVTGVPPLVAFFAFNEDGSTGPTYNGLACPDMLVWASVTLCPDGGAISASCSTFILGNNGVTTPPSIAASDLPDNPNQAQVAALQAAGWVYVHGTICVDGGGAFAGFPDPTTGNCAAGTTPKSQVNLGQNNVAFMIDSPALDTALGSAGANAVLHITWEMAYISGGGETAFFAPVSTVQVPEPATLALVGLGLFAAGVGRRTKHRKS